jgi:hypothetical protein
MRSKVIGQVGRKRLQWALSGLSSTLPEQAGQTL